VSLLNNTSNPRDTYKNTKMCQYKIVACIVLILSVFSFVLAVPVVVQEAREAYADAVDGGDNVIIGSGKRADVQEEDPLLAQAQQEPSSSDGGANLIQSVTSTETQPASSSNRKSVSWAPEREVRLPSGKTYSEMLPPEVEPLPRPLFMDAIQANVAAHQSPKPQSKNIFRKLLGKLKFQFSRRISGTAGGVVTEG
jgi:hypothetical protein